jgi:hypothetical protein
MHRITVDKDKNRLLLTLGRLESTDEILEVVEKIKTVCRDLKPGFSCLNDLRDYELVDAGQESLIRQAQEFLVKAGLARVVRVVRKFGTWGHLQFDKTSMNVGYHARNVNTIEEALAILDNEGA